jgi:hydrogenase maturation protein HypF
MPVPVCGPRWLSLWERTADDGLWFKVLEGDEALKRAAEALRAGQIVAVKGLGGFHLMADARNAGTIARLRERKPRRDKPFALMVRDLTQARALCDIPAEAEALLTSPEAPIVLLRRQPGRRRWPRMSRRETPIWGSCCPTRRCTTSCWRELDFPVVATSGNLSDEPICTDEAGGHAAPGPHRRGVPGA